MNLLASIVGFFVNFLYWFFRSLSKMVLYLPLLVTSPVVAWFMLWGATLASQYPDTLLGSLAWAFFLIPLMLMVSFLFEWYQEQLDKAWARFRMKYEAAQKWDWLHTWLFDHGYNSYSSRLGWLAAMMVGVSAYFVVGFVFLGALTLPYAPWLLPVFPTNP